ncbi:MAG: sugar phosphate isomerase/epimerase [Armatimonadetes bacterium]|nr:sugar phosphate isomerase/epimerase [Armatimonadota bacterium]
MFPAINPAYLTGTLDHWPLEALAGMGFRGLEVTPACLDAAPLWQPVAEKSGLRPVCVNALPELRPYLTGSLSDAVVWRRQDTLKRLKGALLWMRRESVPYLVVAPSRLAENYQSVEQARRLLIESLKELASQGDSHILLESVPSRLFTRSSEIAAIIDEAGLPNLGAALDVGHTLLSGESPSDAAQALGPRLCYVQVRDVDLRPGVPRLDRHLPLGEGSLASDEVRAAVSKRPYAVCVTAPGHPLEAARQSLAWLAD